ncbi:MAG: tetratricopeptide repeat protein, partial [bacterium]|nr:tetratricopeptide repeat protein [bacterium]
LLGNFTEAERLWKEALDAFNKFPEAHYGLGQTLIALGKKRAARMMIGKSIMSDLHLLRDRINDLKEAYAK